MASGASTEVVHCPNCKEDVPKTLYCLNCGFPLYREEQPKEEKAEPDTNPEPIVANEEDAVIVVDDPAEEAKPALKVEAKPEPAPEKKIEQVDVTEIPAQSVEPTPQPNSVEVKEPEKTPEPSPVIEVKAPTPEEAIPPVVEAKPPPMELPKPVEVTNEPVSNEAEPSKIEAIEMVEEYQEEMQNKGYVPDPLSKDLMENLTKNISLKLKLTKLYRDGVVKEETFTKLFDDYSKQGKILFSRREEILTKLSGEIEEMEDDYSKASEALELIEIKRSIGEISEIEYSAKAPAYRWDIDHFDLTVAEKKNKTRYLENIGGIISKEELKELRELASLEYNTLDALQISKDESLNSIKESLYEAIKTLG